MSQSGNKIVSRAGHGIGKVRETKRDSIIMIYNALHKVTNILVCVQSGAEWTKGRRTSFRGIQSASQTRCRGVNIWPPRLGPYRYCRDGGGVVH